MGNNLVSVIVPIYKVEQYLDRCISSIVSQTYQNLEIILVDDGSPDGCPKMCDKWAKQDSRIRVIHKANGGQSSARNAGLDICTGDYILFVDSDDWIELDTVEQCVLEINIHKSDIVVFGVREVSDQNIEKEYFSARGLTYDAMLEHFCLMGDPVWNKMYRKSIWNDLRFEQGLIFEDAYVLADVYGMVSNIHFISRFLYNFNCSNSGSTMHTIYYSPKEPWYRWKYESHIVDRLGSKLNSDLLIKVRVRAMEHAIKMLIIDFSIHCLKDDEKRMLYDFVMDEANQKLKLKFEYFLYNFSLRHLNIINRIKSLEYLWKYRNRQKRGK